MTRKVKLLKRKHPDFGFVLVHPYQPKNVVRVLELDEYIDVLATKKKLERRKYCGPSIRGAAVILDVSRQRVYQLIREGKLDVIELYSSLDPDDHGGGHQVGAMVTWDSIERFKKSGRKPGRRRKDSRADAR